jgi:hypothetical protein
MAVFGFLMLGGGAVECSKGVDLADIMDQSEQPPLYIHFQFGAERKAGFGQLPEGTGGG